jgi:hypothetical protein
VKARGYDHTLRSTGRWRQAKLGYITGATADFTARLLTNEGRNCSPTMAPGSFSSLRNCFFWRKDFLPVEPPPQADLSFLFLLGAPRFA